ncbi:hypothetical protein C548_131 [Candidatus Portiera aleyrodidarum BT-QVLC]|nr:hypothetical protein C548_131 [Candidatus Portiera aleyrodidarum BT-QVLC]
MFVCCLLFVVCCLLWLWLWLWLLLLEYCWKKKKRWCIKTICKKIIHW